MPEQLVGLAFAQADALAHACDLGFRVYLVPSAFAPVDGPEHRFAPIVSRVTWLHATLLRTHAVDREATRPHHDAPVPAPPRMAES